MNTFNNKRRRESVQRIKEYFLYLLEGKELQKITVSEICSGVSINRSTFYANFTDVYDLAEHIKTDLVEEVDRLFGFKIEDRYFVEAFMKLLDHIKNNQKLYSFYFKLNYDIKDLKLFEFDNISGISSDRLEYHIEFFRNGFNAIIKLWLKNGCKEEPAEICDILMEEYKGRF